MKKYIPRTKKCLEHLKGECDKGETTGDVARKMLQGLGLHEACGPACEQAADKLFVRQSDLESNGM